VTNGQTPEVTIPPAPLAKLTDAETEALSLAIRELTEAAGFVSLARAILSKVDREKLNADAVTVLAGRLERLADEAEALAGWLG
jgi:hypothetical protein